MKFTNNYKPARQIQKYFSGSSVLDKVVEKFLMIEKYPSHNVA